MPLKFRSSLQYTLAVHLLVAIVASVAIGGAGCAARQAAFDKVSVAELGVSSDAAIYIGIDKGYFAEQHIEVDPQHFGAVTDVVPQLATGKLDVGSGAPNAGFFNALASGIPIRIVASNQQFEPGRDGGAVVIRKDLAGTIRDPAALKGKRLGIAGRGGVAEILYGRLLSQAGLSEQDVDLVRVSSLPDLLTGLENNSIDVSTLAEPLLSAAVARGEVVIWKPYAEIAPGSENNLLTYSAAFAARTDVARRFMLAWIKAVRFYNDALFNAGDRNAFISIMTTYTQVTDTAAYAHMSFSAIDPNGRVDIESLSSMQDWYSAHGYIGKPADVPAAVDPSFATYAVGVLGPYP